MARPKILVFQHVPYEPLGTLDPLLKAAGFRTRYVNFGRTPEMRPMLDKYAVVIILGGPMNCDQIDRHPKPAIKVAVIREAVEATLTLLYPMTPHLCEELWQLTGHETTLTEVTWPIYDEEAARDEEITVVLQVNGKVRTRLQVAPDTDQEELKEKAMLDANVLKFTEGKTIRKVIVVPNKLVNIVAT